MDVSGSKCTNNSPIGFPLAVMRPRDTVVGFRRQMVTLVRVGLSSGKWGRAADMITERRTVGTRCL